ncbi:hypothetical protein [Castellaniella sp. UC4442_H9]
METRHAIGETAEMDTTLKEQIARLLAQARDITQETLGSTPATVVAEVFRALHLDAGMPPETEDGVDHDPPHAVH